MSRIALAALSLSLLVASDAAASPILARVSQESAPGAGDFDANVLGFVQVYQTPLTAAGFYSYGVPNAVSFNNPAVPLQINTSHLFLAQTANGRVLFSVHDRPVHGTGLNNGGGAADTHYDAQMPFPALANFLVLDDPGDTYATTGLTFDAVQNWGNPNTDGVAIGALDLAPEIFARFDSWTGLDQWRALSADGSNIPLELVEGRRVRFDQIQAVPEPATLAVFAAGGVALLARRRRQCSI